MFRADAAGCSVITHTHILTLQLHPLLLMHEKVNPQDKKPLKPQVPAVEESLPTSSWKIVEDRVKKKISQVWPGYRVLWGELGIAKPHWF